MEKYGHTVWHQSVIPEEELYLAGIIHDFNKHRLIRIAKRKENPQIKYNDYGIDILAKDSDGNYYPCQAKHYTSRKVRASDIGTFTIVIICQTKSSGYLYTTGKLEINLKENIMNSEGRIVHHRIDFKLDTDIVKEEIDMTLRNYQQDAIKAIVEFNDTDESKAIIEMTCGTGKTLIIGHALKQMHHNKIVCIAPLRISTEQLYNRIQPFLNDHKHLLVDSDNNGTTDIEEIKEFMKNEKYVIYSTFKSFKEILWGNFEDDEYLVVDECHNLLNKKDLVDICNSFDGLFVSATIPEELFEVLNAKKIYHYGIVNAIKDKYICDYEIYLPYIVDNNIEVNAPEVYKNDLGIKSLFLATGMLRTGSRRCVAYLRTCEECDEFIEMLIQVMKAYHGLNVWCKKIDQSVSNNKREQILKDFQYDIEYDLYVIASVRVLDEAIDIPRCDSTFISHVGDHANDIRYVQRIMRGGRLDSQNPFKKNNAFMFCVDWSNIITSLSILKEEDIEFHKKIRILNINYDDGSNKEKNEEVKKLSTVLNKFIEVKCLSLFERFKLRVEEWQKMYDKLGRYPSENSKEYDEKNIACWQHRVRIYKKKNLLLKERIEFLESIDGWTWKFDKFLIQFNKWKLFYEKYNKLPRQVADDNEQYKLASWQIKIRSAKKNNILNNDHEQLLSNTNGWEWEFEPPFRSNYEKWVEFYIKYKRLPNKRSKNEDEKKLGYWQSKMREAKQKKGHCKLTSDNETLLTNTTGWLWTKQDHFTNNYNLWVNTYNKKPNNKSTDPIERKIYNWVVHLRMTKRDKSKSTYNLTEDQIAILDADPDWRW
jgi:superfamily II DNA or RNA helicase